MSDDLRAQIAMIQRAHVFCIVECSCGYVIDSIHPSSPDWKTDAEADWADHVADAVIRELALRQEWSVEYTPGGESPPMPQLYEWSCGHERITEHREQAQFDAATFTEEPDERAHPVSRYVTDWKADDASS